MAAPVAAAPGEPAPDPIRPGPALQAIALKPSAGILGRAAATVVVPRRETGPFALAGVTWNDPAADLPAVVEVRARSVATGAWSAWQALESDGRSPAEPGSNDARGRGRTDPVWLGTSDAIEARSTGAGTLPAGLRLDLINPDATDDVRPAGRAAAAVPPRPSPRFVSRAAWGANESIVKLAPEYTTGIKVVFVHHTATANGYNCADSARIVRGIQSYHVRSNKWNDIGYNFLLDRCGKLFEGRKGGVARPVLGAHTMGFNASASAIAVIGNYDGVAAPAPVPGVIAQVAAWKLGAYGASPSGRVALISSGSDRFKRGTRVTLNRISGHRDAGQTTCPGDVLYGQLGSIRKNAGAAPAGLRVPRMPGATAHGQVYYTRGSVTLHWALSTPSSLLHRFDVYVDGKLYTTARNTGRVAALRLPAGLHTVTVIAVHLNGRTSRISRTVMSDATPPKFVMGPALILRPGALNGSVPVRLGWGLGDPSGVRAQALTSPRPTTFGANVRSYNSVAAPNTTSLWAVKATDRAGNSGVGTVRGNPVTVPDTTSVRAGTWTTVRHPRYLGGTALQSGSTGSSIVFSVSGRSVALAVARTPGSGHATIYVDGQRSGTIDLSSPSAAQRIAVWAKNWGASGNHTVKIVSSGARPGIVIDGLVVLR